MVQSSGTSRTATEYTGEPALYLVDYASSDEAGVTLRPRREEAFGPHSFILGNSTGETAPSAGDHRRCWREDVTVIGEQMSIHMKTRKMARDPIQSTDGGARRDRELMD